ncbi:MAG: hypothetical protein DWP98_02135 [Bacteroidetes bacterium]|nr:MAG: hypothetical protein DWP98_02135 [Bacteroidota bacterium]MBL1145544.1 hypothetical protein [Bacteroidota bacterium]NOG58341.1 hypothetical protein [Bacteroidota bacterium]
MKNLFKTTDMLMALTIGMVSCEKEETNFRNNANNRASVVLSSKVDKVNQRLKNKLLSMSEADYVAIAAPIKAQLEVNHRLNNDKSLNAIPLEDIFFIHEGVINSIYTTPLDPEDESEIFTTTHELEVSLDENNNYIIEINDYNEFFTNVSNTLSSEVSPQEGEYLSLTDLELISIENDVAVIQLKSIVSQPPVNQTFNLLPGGEVYGADLAGWCDTNLTGTDASVFINNTIQKLGANTITGSTCPTNTGRYLFVMGTFNTMYSNDAVNHGLTYSYVLSKIWKDVTNSCVGDNSNSSNNNTIWQNWYNNASSLVNAPIAHYSTWGNAVFCYGQLSSDSYNNSTIKLAGSYNFYHKAMLFYGIEICP